VLEGIAPYQGIPPHCEDLIGYGSIRSRRALTKAILRRMRETPKDLLTRAVPTPETIRYLRQTYGHENLQGKFVESNYVIFDDSGKETVLKPTEWFWFLSQEEIARL
jgi:hypothetical protein